MADQSYELTVDLNVLDHLSDGLYSNVAAVITEVVANAWDAEATEVRITYDMGEDKLLVHDNGTGMDKNEANEHFLTVGYKRRTVTGDVTENLKRPVMGRKGIGKLSTFSIANDIKVKSKKINMKSPIGFHISVPALRTAMEQKAPKYYPTPITVEDGFPEHGTHIEISNLKEKRLRGATSETLRRRLARRFSVIGSSTFKVWINNVEVTASDRDDLKFVEYLWVFGDELPDAIEASIDDSSNFKSRFHLDATNSLLTDGCFVKGWIGTVDTPRSLSTPEGNLNSIVVLSRGRLVMEDVLPQIAGAEMYTKYLTGQVEADFLDDSLQGDIVTSNRQSLIEDDARYEQLVRFLKKAVRSIADKWTTLRTEDKTDELRENYPNVGIWLDNLPAGWKPKAERLLSKIAVMEFSRDTDDQNETKKTLLRHAIFGFERLRIRGDAEELEVAISKGADAVLRLLADRDSLEAALYIDIVKNRLEVIEKLLEKVDDNEKERVLQEYLFDHLWLLDPSWERATADEAMETRLRLRPEFSSDDPTKEKYGRTDIQFRTCAGKHIIVELKRASVNTRLYELADQGSKYVEAYKALLPVEERDRAIIEVVFVVGEIPDEADDRIKKVMESVSPGSSLKTYEQLTLGAKRAYGSYLEHSASVDRIDRLLSSD